MLLEPWQMLTANKNTVRAIVDYTQAIALSPKDPEFYDNRGHAYERKGDKEQAIADFRRALKFHPSLQTSNDGLQRLRATN